MFEDSFTCEFTDEAEQFDTFRSLLIDREKEFIDWFNFLLEECESAEVSVKILKESAFSKKLKARIANVKKACASISKESACIDAEFVEREYVYIADEMLVKLTGDVEDLVYEVKDIKNNIYSKLTDEILVKVNQDILEDSKIA